MFYPVCDCDSSGTSEEICNKTTGQCLCKENFMFPRCDRCAPGYYNYPMCQGQSQSYIHDLGEKWKCLKFHPHPLPSKKKKNIIIQYIMKNLELYVNTLVNFSTEDRYTCSEFIPTDMKNIEFCCKSISVSSCLQRL